jgi:asparagine synthase (glutamine-hydrolysing)
MCGIFATTRADRWRNKFSGVLHDLAHRGPDAQGLWEDPDGQVALAHTRLAVIGLGDPGAQPATFSDGKLVLTYNGEIYNFRELASAYGLAPPACDTTFVGEALIRSGSEGLAAARGMFAYAAWDRIRGRLSFGRDQWGIKPLYVLRHPDGGVTVSSVIRPLLRLEEAQEIDPLGMAQYLAFGHTGPLLTVFRHIRKCAPGVAWEVSAEAHKPSFVAARSIKCQPSIPMDVDKAMVDSVGAHLVSDVEVGVFMSSGTDSTLLAAIASQLTPGIRTFTISFPEHPEIDESPLAEANAHAMGTKHRTIPITTKMLVQNAEAYLKIHGEPFGDPAALPLVTLARAAREDVKVVLGGEGADELFGGYGRYRISRLSSSFMFRSLGAFPAVARGWGRVRSDKPRSRAIQAAFLGGGFSGHAALVGSELPVLEHAMPELMGEVDRLARTTWASVRSDDPSETARRFDTITLLPDGYLEKTDRATMAAGLEARVPYLDPVVEAAAAGRTTPGKADLVAALARRLPAMAAPPRKKGLAVHLPALLEAGLGSHCEYELGSSDSVVHGLLGTDGTRLLAARCRRSAMTSYRVAMLGLWEANLPFSPRW